LAPEGPVFFQWGRGSSEPQQGGVIRELTFDHPIKVMDWNMFPVVLPKCQCLYFLLTHLENNNRCIGMVFILSESHTPLARLVLFMVCLSAAGACVAGVHYFSVNLPQQQAVQAPSNAGDDHCCQSGTCQGLAVQCQSGCTGSDRASCLKTCYSRYHNGGETC
jgi:hypothetical protein